ncbi:MAG: spore photoproduct lyase family protein [Gammaproteobacteria bacterium]|jgi:spore photoproduct lyase
MSLFSTIYIEDEIASHPRTLEICARFPRAAQIPCMQYGEVFNPKAQNFRLQKSNPALILANKNRQRIHPVPESYGIGGSRNYYFSHMLNCLYDCRYCFLQGMFRSAYYVLFVNYEDFLADIGRVLADSRDQDTWFFSGYDCDSLALDPVSGFAGEFLPFFATHPHAYLELRTKSTQIRGLLKHRPLENVVTAFSFTPAEIYASLEHKVPAIERRLEAMAQLQKHGWLLGLRFDPLVYQEDFEHQYSRLFEQVFSLLDVELLHSVSLGPFRLPRGYFKNILQLYPDEPLFAGPFAESNGMVSYRAELENEMTAFCTRRLLEYVPESLLYPCQVAA